MKQDWLVVSCFSWTWWPWRKRDEDSSWDAADSSFLPALTLPPSHRLHPLLSSSCKALTPTPPLQWIPGLWITPPPWKEVVPHMQHECMWSGQQRGRSRCTQCQELRGRLSLGRQVGGEGEAVRGRLEGLRASELERSTSVGTAVCLDAPTFVLICFILVLGWSFHSPSRMCVTKNMDLVLQYQPPCLCRPVCISH